MVERKSHLEAKKYVQQLMRDPEYVKRLVERDKEKAEAYEKNRKEIRPLLDQLQQQGFMLNTLSDFRTRVAILSRGPLLLLIDFLAQTENRDIQEDIIRTIGATRLVYDGTPLAKLFDQSDSFSLKWAIGNTFAISKPKGVGEWILGALRDTSHDRAREMLCDAAARHCEPEAARAALIEVFDQMPGHAARGLGRVGGPDELAFLESKTGEYKTWERNAIKSAIKKIEKRIERKESK